MAALLLFPLLSLGTDSQSSVCTDGPDVPQRASRAKGRRNRPNLTRFCAKTKLCAFHLRGLCKRGDSCTYAHESTEIQAAPDLSCTKLCPTVLKTGSCSNDACKFAHSTAELRRLAVDVDELETPPSPQRASAPCFQLKCGSGTGLAPTDAQGCLCDAPILLIAIPGTLQLPGKLGEVMSLAAKARNRFSPAFSLLNVPENAYLSTAFGLDERSLCRLDSTCRATRSLNQAPIGPWRALGVKRYRGVELVKEGRFEDVPSPLRAKMRGRINWRSRYFLYARLLPTFRAPFKGREISRVQKPQAVAHCQCMVSADIDVSVYIEFCVRVNPDNLSIGLVDFDAGGRSSLTFSPDTGAVLWERKLQEEPRMVQGSFCQPLTGLFINQHAFEGSVGVYIHAGHVAYFRRWFSSELKQPAGWETTGYIADLSWAEGPCVTPCIAFRDEGLYQVRIVGIRSVPPVDLGQLPESYDESLWTDLDWDAQDSDDS